MNSYIINSLLCLQHLRFCFHPCQQSPLLVTRLAPLAEFYGSSALCLFRLWFLCSLGVGLLSHPGVLASCPSY